MSDPVLNRPSPDPERDLAAWVTSYGPGLRRFFSRRAHDADVDDLVQDVFMRLQAVQLNAPIDNVERYLFTIARNVLISRYRRGKIRFHSLHEGYEDAPEMADDMSPERIVIGRQEYSRAVEVILNLPPRARAAFLFHRFENMTYQAIAARMGISKESVKELMHRAIVRISQEMGGDA
ncbi:RNA polymerase sigma factor [Sphingomonas alpina]|uniref:RNA polymerase sigma factor n=1 Tax=Sphingomonas alpina TaxID=653931 RepID=A0A7H0LFV2_9SPHN|nr:RNA polymerase sigma factor [Sphingomonas alpina]QNQ08555.1 RNA polymerase sigma factor [Sphingomonas alpina]